MAHKGYDFFIAEPHSTDAKRCRVCGVPCRVTRNVFGPTGFVTAMAGLFRVHDEWVCPLTDEPWHARARQLVIAIEDTPSKRLAMLMSEDLGELLQENLPAS